MTIVSFLKLVEIQTKVASMLPFLLGTAYALYRFERFNAVNFFLMLLALLTFDMTTTALNNYMDYKKAIKKQGFGYESHNAIVHYKLKESTVQAVLVIMLAIAAGAGILLYLHTGVVVLLLGILSFGIGILYSFGPVPISRTPFGEIFSGLTMGFIITFLAVYIHIWDMGFIDIAVQGYSLGILLNVPELLYMLLLSILPVCGIANIMLANNICDIEDDIENRRYTLPVYIGRERALKLFQWIYYTGYVSVLLGVLLKVLPVPSLIVMLSLPAVNKNIKAFFRLQSKKETFALSVKNFIISNAVYGVVMLAAAINHII